MVSEYTSSTSSIGWFSLSLSNAASISPSGIPFYISKSFNVLISTTETPIASPFRTTSSMPNRILLSAPPSPSAFLIFSGHDISWIHPPVILL